MENKPWMTLASEDTQERGPNGLHAISVAHYGEQNGDLMVSVRAASTSLTNVGFC